MSDTPNIGDLRIWYVINPPAPAVRIAVATPREGWELINRIADKQLHQPWVVVNAFGLEVYTGDFMEPRDDGWEDWYDDEGRDVFEAFDD